ncbi:hypothetical protein HF576_02000 [Microbacterium sp. CFH 90308]|uniref:Uncharacterized protein n=1 Tax=Microbacterium salsuginis TaxID=2722803 RepID=A0ABX1K7W1_9MICO|nr:hypothetical protein [Microbacterium sp. CFH 90308]NLP82612.1 hypothetical protein [Microbacterium sp. CFH 90308]
MVKLAPSLPKEYDDNGLESNTRHLLNIYPKQEYVPVVALVRTKEITQTENFERVPKVEIVHIEIAVDADDQEDVRDLIQRLHDGRVQHIKQPLDLPDTDPEPATPLELEASVGEYSIEISDEAPGVFGLSLVAASGAHVLDRHALPRAEYGEILPGAHTLHLLEPALGELVRQLIGEYEQGFAVSEDDVVVDAELVDETTTTEED